MLIRARQVGIKIFSSVIQSICLFPQHLVVLKWATYGYYFQVRKEVKPSIFKVHILVMSSSKGFQYTETFISFNNDLFRE